MSGATTPWAGNALDLLTGRAAALPAPRNTYLALLSGNPGDVEWTLATMPEITTAGYARQQVVWTVPAGAPLVTANNALLFFGPFTADMSSAVNYGALVSAASGTTGDLIFLWPLSTPQLAVTSESLQLAAGVLTLNT